MLADLFIGDCMIEDDHGPQRILVIARVFPPKPGGIERFIYELHAHLPESRNVRVIAPNFQGSSEFDATSRLSNVSRAPYWGPRYKLSYLPLLPLAVTAAIKRRPELVVCDQVGTGVVGVVLNLLFGIPFVVFVYGAELYERRGRRLRRLVYRRAARVIACSSDSANRVVGFAGLERDAVGVVMPAVDADRYAQGDAARARSEYGLAGRRVILTVARLEAESRYKGQDVVIRALPRVIEAIPDAIYIVAGGGNDYPRLEALAAAAGVRDRVRFTGALPDSRLIDLYHAADVFVMVSRDSPDGMTEGFGIVYLEANAAGKPVVYSASGGAAEAVVDGVTGLRADPYDTESIADAIVRILSDPVLAQQLGEGGLERSKEFNWAVSARAYVTLLRALA